MIFYYSINVAQYVEKSVIIPSLCNNEKYVPLHLYTNNDKQ